MKFSFHGLFNFDSLLIINAIAKLRILSLSLILPLALNSQVADTLQVSSTWESRGIKCIMLDSILNNRDVQVFLDIWDTKNYRACVRFVNTSESKFDCKFYFINKNDIPISCFTTSKADFTLNVGYFRDVIIDNVSENGNEVTLSVYVPHFKKQYSMEQLPHMFFTFSVINDKVKLKSILRDYARAPVGND